MKTAKFADLAAKWIITLAGLAGILAMIAMLILIVREAAPLFFPARQAKIGAARLPADLQPREVAALGVDSDVRGTTRVAEILLRDGRYGYLLENAAGTGPFSFSALPDAPADAAVAAVDTRGGGAFTVLWNNASATLYSFQVEYPQENPAAASGVKPAKIPPAATARVTLKKNLATQFDPNLGQPLFAMLRGEPDNSRSVAIYADGNVRISGVRPGKGIRQRGKSQTLAQSAQIALHGKRLTAAALNGSGSQLYLGTSGGDLIGLDLSSDTEGNLPVAVTPAYRDRREITALSFLSGDYAIAVGDAAGGVAVWFPRREEGAFRLRRSVAWPGGDGEIRAFAPSGRSRCFFALAQDSAVKMFHSTTGKELLSFGGPAQPPVRAMAMNERADLLLTLQNDGGLVFRQVTAPYPEAGWSGFFRRLLYEGYEKAAFIWQSTGDDASEPKLSLVPLIFGSFKGAVYALLFATPLALAAALYLSQFAPPAWRPRLKPAVEMLAAAPSVVIGFLAALWLAPLLEKHLGFLSQHFAYDQRNSLVIAVAMGFAVIPTVFSLADDALAAVPPSLSAASLALGATKWQTVCRVVIPSASPGIFTAVMLGFGRAVGETMIVLMAAGNTPIISLSPFNGMRTLSANIAVEMPEAPVGGTLYRTLFLCALILFLITLVVNTAAEIFRQRLRRRYGRL